MKKQNPQAVKALQINNSASQMNKKSETPNNIYTLTQEFNKEMVLHVWDKKSLIYMNSITHNKFLYQQKEKEQDIENLSRFKDS